MLDFRLKAYRRWLTMAEPEWSDNRCAVPAQAVLCAQRGACTCQQEPSDWLVLRHWSGLCGCRYPRIDFQDISYYSAPKQKSEKVTPLTCAHCPLLSSTAFRLPDGRQQARMPVMCMHSCNCKNALM